MHTHKPFLVLLVLLMFPVFLGAQTVSPFTEGTDVVVDDDLSRAGYITDVDTAEAAGVVAEKGFPASGTISCGTNLRLRTWPWGEVISTHSPGTSLNILGVSGEFYLVEIDGKQGYMHRNYISMPDKPASQVEPDYPGNTRDGGALSLAEGVKRSKAAGASISATSTPAVSTTGTAVPGTSAPSTTGTPATGVQTGSNGKVSLDVPTQCQMKVNCPAPGSACGPTALAMALAYYTKKDPGSLATSLWDICGSTADSGTGHSGLLKGAARYGYPNAKWNYSVGQSWIREQIKAGKPMIAHVKGHYVCITGIDDSGNIYYNDPGRSQVKQQKSFADFSAWWTGGGSKHAVMTLQ